MEKLRVPDKKSKEGAGGSFFGGIGGTEESTMLSVVSGPYSEELPVVGMTVEQVKSKYKDRLDIHPESFAVVDGEEVDDDAVLTSNHISLVFARRAGEKGAGRTSVLIEGAKATAKTPEGAEASIGLSTLSSLLSTQAIDTNGIIMPDGVKLAVSKGKATILVHQTPPRVFNFKWIDENSPSPYGSGTKYQVIQIALPYLVMVVVYVRQGKDFIIQDNNECFFLNTPLTDIGQELLYPALLNCSKYSSSEGNPLAWICTQHLTNRPRNVYGSLKELMNCLIETGFNLSSEHHEGSSWFTETVNANIDKRLSSVKEWQKATKKDPNFVLSVPWLKTGKTVGQVVDRIFRNMGIDGNPSSFSRASQLARVIFNQGEE